MDVQINQAGTNHEAVDIHFSGAGRRLMCRVRAHRGDFTLENQNIRLCVEAVGRVDDASTGKKQRFHAQRGYTRDIDNASAGIKLGWFWWRAGRVSLRLKAAARPAI